MSEVITRLEGYQAAFESKIAGLSNDLSDVRRQVDNIDARMQHPGTFGGAGKTGDSAEQIALAIIERKDAFFANGRIRFETPSPTLATKTAVTSSGLTVSASSDRFGLADASAYGAVRNLFPNLTLDEAAVLQIRETAATGWAASPQTEASAKAESAANLTAATLNVRTIAHWIPATKQSLADVVGLSNHLRARLFWGLAKKIEEQILWGDGTGENLSGISLDATAANTSLYGSGWDYYSIIIYGMAQLRAAGFRPNFIVINPLDGGKMRNRRATDNQFLVPPPGTMPEFVIESPAVTAGQFVMGDSGQAAVRVRQQAVIDVSESHSDYFVRNMVAIRVEERLLFDLISPAAFIYGSFVGSPA